MEALIEACGKLNMEDIQSCVSKAEDSTDFKGIFGKVSRQFFVKGQTPEGQVKAIDFLVETGADINVLDTHGYAVIHYASHYPDQTTSILPKLIALGADINILTEPHGFTPLHLCCQRTDCYDDNGLDVYSKNIRLLLKAGADVNIADSKGKTALHYLVASRHSDQVESLVKLLLDRGANINARDSQNQTALHLSHFTQEIRDTYITAGWDEFLILQGANVNLRDTTSDKEIPLQHRFSHQMFFRGINLFNAGNKPEEKGIFPFSLKHILVLSLKAGLDPRRFPRDVLSCVVHELLKAESFKELIVLFEGGGRVYIHHGRYCSWAPHILAVVKALNAYTLSLKRQAANAIRTTLTPNALKGVDKLGLPRSLNEYITLKEYDGSYYVTLEK